MKLSYRDKLLGCTAALAMCLAGASAAQAQDDTEDRIIVTGVRGQARTVSDSPVPVDVIGADELEAVPYTDTNDIIRTLVPSYDVSRQPISDGGTFIRPASMRGLPTDKTLVLVNSHRRHRAALVSIGGSGTQGPDIATIPSAALASVEVLRDGAAAQYGSDAIAGVLNFILKDNDEGGTLTVETGQYYQGDGFGVTISGNVGFALGDSGFLSVSGEYSTADATSRSEQYCDSWFCLDQNNPDFNPTGWYIPYLTDEFRAAVNSLDGVVQPWGQPNSEAYRLFFNAGYELAGTMELYAFGNYSQSEADGSFFYRYPENGTITDLREADGSIYNPLEIFPGGFTPRFFGEVYDYSLLSGLTGDMGPVAYDFSARFGHNEIQYTLANTINPSLGPNTPTSFRPGDLINEEFQLQADFTYEFDAGMASPALLAFGLSYLDESYEIVGGEPASYEAGPYATPDPWGLCSSGAPTAAGLTAIAGGSTLDCADSSDPVYTVVGVGSNGFPGYSPEFSGTYERDSIGAYVDISADVTDRLFLQAAARYEDYSDFDSELVGKIAGQFDLTDTVGLRASIGTGFRAPTPGQQGTTNVSTRLPNGFPVATGLFPASGPVAQALGAEPLGPETSVNYTFGVTSEFDNGVSLTVDFYRIDLADRVNAISTQPVSSDPTAGVAYTNYLALTAAGVVGAESIGGVFYFANAFDTITEGVDVVATYTADWASLTTDFTASFNYNTTEFDGNVDALFNAESQYDFVNGAPEWRGVFSAVHMMGDWTILGRASVYGPYSNANDASLATIQEWDPEVLFDAEVSYQFTDDLRLSAGARNIFDNYPDPGEMGETCCGRIYRSDSVVDWQGGYYYLKLRADF
ncbi:TonB-dependent receptor plug domain-containing protein [Maricaulis parjimensis]|uniref:TonB-dependent receptor plug domain-containing protein n=1 Tax=Maricaulis parjimensis TaxID=144023 RepID=UPI00193A5F98|nr:TonB-dependent receptor [Maricaulis parjimensis]